MWLYDSTLLNSVFLPSKLSSLSSSWGTTGMGDGNLKEEINSHGLQVSGWMRESEGKDCDFYM
jgi:hypothetical protein